MGSGMKTKLNQTLNNVLNTCTGNLFGAIVTLCQFDLLASIKSPTGITLEIKVTINELNV